MDDVDYTDTGSRGENFTIEMLLTKQMDRAGYLLTLGTTSNNEDFDAYKVARALWQSNLYIEAILNAFLSKDYKLKVGDIKKEIENDLKEFDFYNVSFVKHWNDWFALLVKELSMIGMLPRPSVSYTVANRLHDKDKFVNETFDMEEKEFVEE